MKLSTRKQLLSEADITLKSLLTEAPFGKKAENDPRNTRQLKVVIPQIQKTTSTLESQIQNMLAKNTDEIMKKLQPLVQGLEWTNDTGKVNRVRKILSVSTFPKAMMERDVFENKIKLDVRLRLAVGTENSGYVANFSLQNLLSYAKGKTFTDPSFQK